MFKYHPTFKFLQIHKKLSDALDNGIDLKILITEDNIPIRKIHAQYRQRIIYTIPELLYIFSIYGEVEDIEIVTKKDKKRDTYCFVTFKDANFATKILMNRHRLHDLFLIHAADSWHQPDLINPRSTRNDENIIPQSTTSLLDLNEYCLRKITSFLDPFELLVLRNVCIRLAQIVDIQLKSSVELNVISMKQQRKLTLMEMRHLFYYAGKATRRLILSSEKFDNGNCTRILQLIPKYCKNVEYLKLSGFRLNLDVWRKFSHLLRNLKYLDLSDSCELRDDAFNCFKTGTHKLEELNIANNNLVNGKFLQNLKNLLKLDISNCQNIDGKHLKAFSDPKQNNFLKFLNISHNNNLLEADVNIILKNLSPSLEFLVINNYYFGQQDEIRPLCLKSLDNLKSLAIINIFFPTEDQPLDTLCASSKIEELQLSSGKLTESSLCAISNLKNLKKLILNSKAPAESHIEALMVDFLIEIDGLEEVHFKDCLFVNLVEVLRLIEFSRNLRFLDLTKYYGLNNESILQVTEILEIQRKSMKLVVSQTEVDYKVLESTNFSKDFLELIWRQADENLLHDYDIDERINLLELQQESQENYNWNDVIEILKMTEDDSEEQFLGLFKT